MATELLGRIIFVKPAAGELNLRDPQGNGSFDPNDPGTIDVVNDSVQRDEDVGTASFRLRRTGGTGVASVDFETVDGSALAGTSYYHAFGTVEWGDGEYGEKTIEVDLIHRQGEQQGNLQFAIELSNPFNADIQKEEGGALRDTITVTIRDLDSPTTDEGVEVTWNGDFSTGNYLQWHVPGDPSTPRLNAMPPYGRPVPYGNGDLSELVTSPQRGPSPYSVRLTVKNAENGGEPEDCHRSDPNWCHVRRTNLNGWSMYTDYMALPANQTWWLTTSVWIPPDIDDEALREGFSFGCKAEWDTAAGAFGLNFTSDRNSWMFQHRHHPEGLQNPGHMTWTRNHKYHDQIGLDSGGYDPLVIDFPDPDASRAALGSVVKGAWTDWMFQIHPDWRAPKDGGQGFINVYKRDEGGPVVHVAHIPALDEITIAPGTSSEETMQRGIGYNTDGYWISAMGLYTSSSKEKFLNAPNNTTLFFTNTRVHAGGDSINAIANHMIGG